MRRLRLPAVPLLAGLAATVVLFVPSAALAGPRQVPPGFMGVNLDGPLFTPLVDQDRELAEMVRSGVESVRFGVFWNSIQPYRSFRDIPKDDHTPYVDEGGIPTDWRFVDDRLRQAAQYGLQVRPFVIGPPPWAERHPFAAGSPPKGTATFARFMTQLVRRYLPRGPFWTSQPPGRRIRVRDWQIWNEENGPVYWSDANRLRDYTALLRASYQAVKRADPHARVVLGGLVGPSWLALRDLYRYGARPYFDVLALHPYTDQIENVVKIIKLNRAEMHANHDDAKPITLTESSWPSALSARGAGKRVRHGYETTESGQATKVRRVFGRIAAVRRALRVEGLSWYTWISSDDDPSQPFHYAGLRTVRRGHALRAKPALAAYRALARRLEGCVKLSVASRCG